MTAMRSRLVKDLESFDKLLCGCQAHYIRGLFFSYDSFTSRPKRDLLLCVARHRAVTLTRNAALSKAQSPGISVSRIEPFREFPFPVLPVVESFPGAMSPLGSKEPNEPFLSPHRSLLHQDHRNPHAEFARHCNNGDPGRHLAGMALANRAEKFSKLAIFSNRRPRGLNELTSKPPIAGMGDRSPIG